MIRRIVLLAAAASLAACGVTVEDNPSPGVTSIRTYISGPPEELQLTQFNHPLGVEGARLQNEWAANKRCPDGFVLFRNAVETDEAGVVLRWDIGCRED
jgi:hypothetical protein